MTAEPHLPIQDIDISNFYYDLPDKLIARHPLSQRDHCRLIVASPGSLSADSDALARILPEKPSISHHRFDEIVELLPDNTLIVRNNTKVINARLHFRKETGASIEIFLLDPLTPADYALNFQQTGECVWKCLVGNLKKWKEGALSAKVKLKDGRNVTINATREQELPGNAHAIRFKWSPEVSFGDIISAFGNIPIPPYLNRESEESDLTDYQTVYATDQGSVAAPTAGLHFTEELLSRLKNPERNISVVDITLHVGAGTFRPVKSETLAGHEMHSETFTISRALVEMLIDACQSDRLVVAVGTTTVRTLESLPYLGTILSFRHAGQINTDSDAPLHVDQWDPYNPEFPIIPTLDSLRAIITEMNLRNTDSLTASTEILIGPGFHWQIVEAMITNFHQPESTLLLLVSSFLGTTPEDVDDPDSLWRRIYREAVKKKYRFLSYGDACLFFRHTVPYFLPISVPGSKSIANRALILNALADPKAILDNLSDSTDTEALLHFVTMLNNRFGDRSEKKLPEDTKPIDFYIGDGAAPIRFATALASVTPGAKVNLFPSERLMQRLLGTSPTLFNGTPLEVKPSCFPASEVSLPAASKKKIASAPDTKKGKGKCLMGYSITGRDFSEAEPFEVSGMEFLFSSQEISALLLVSSRLPEMKITNVYMMPSLGYILMTRSVCRSFGARMDINWDPELELPGSIHTFPGSLRAPERYPVEPDWSALLNFYAFSVAARYSEKERTVVINALNAPDPENSIQPDARIAIMFGYMLKKPEDGVKDPLNLNMHFTPDAMPPVVAGCLVSGTKFTLTGIENLINKESNRIESVIEEFAKLGWTIRLGKKGNLPKLTYNGKPRKKKREENPLLNPHNDHRIAMALASTLPLTGRFRLLNPMCVTKSMPRFWEQLAVLGVNCIYDEKTDIAQLEYSVK